MNTFHQSMLAVVVIAVVAVTTDPIAVTVHNETIACKDSATPSLFQNASLGNDLSSLCKKPTGQFDVPGNCTVFANCWPGRVPAITVCPGGGGNLVFHEKIATCGYPSQLPQDHKCYSASGKAPAQAAAKPAITVVTCIEDHHNVKGSCTAKVGQFEIPGDCSYFNNCWDGHKMACSQGEVFAELNKGANGTTVAGCGHKDALPTGHPCK